MDDIQNSNKISLFDKCFRDSEGKIVLIQIPNLPLLLGILFLVLDFVFLDSVDSFMFYQLGKVFLFVWAYIEASEGINYFRKFIGLVAMLFLILSYL
ncbi:hypothetical protein KC669_03685 [Candidatus Dojkabacteria bacterium]|uniref:Uncharacterized protein n=1 Tax=Candidatus Dojkabacteria bacterium TaxID=2099670 RepID=A0A955LAJ2_9BACT|nr:hypothetical protein [Candidatus Dojkabacteria bacterium]